MIEERPYRRPDWAQLEHLIVGARERGFSESQIEYLQACIGIAWAKGRTTACAEDSVRR